MLRTDLREEIAKINVPVSIISAKNPHIPNLEESLNIQYRALKNKNFHFAENSAHFIMYDQTEWFNNKLKELLN